MLENLYHYTNAAGLLGIVSSASIWSTHISYLNDTEEFRACARAYGDALKMIAVMKHLEPAASEYCVQAFDCLMRDLDTDADESSITVLRDHRRCFITSFSKHDDDLSQWRAYASGGAKFAIGFAVSKLQELEQKAGFALRGVMYQPQSIANQIRDTQVVSIISQCRANLKPHGTFSSVSEFPLSIFRHFNSSVLSSYGALLKHEAFNSEAEWRLIGVDAGHPAQPEPEVKFRAGPSFLVPYVAIPLNFLDGPIVSITVGPTPNMQESLASVRRLPRVGVLSGLKEVRASTVPFRDW